MFLEAWYSMHDQNSGLGVEDKAELKQGNKMTRKDKENNENNRFVRQCFIVRWAVSSELNSVNGGHIRILDMYTLKASFTSWRRL